jgi:hypothetical protein
MPVTSGMDVNAVRELAVHMENSSGQIEQLQAALSSALESTPWLGPDRERFLGEWRSGHVTQLMNVANSLREAAIVARKNADEQEAASS